MDIAARPLDGRFLRLEPLTAALRTASRCFSRFTTGRQ